LRRRPFAERGLKQLFWAVVSIATFLFILWITGWENGLGK
jgi:hypothetical protein